MSADSTNGYHIGQRVKIENNGKVLDGMISEIYPVGQMLQFWYFEEFFPSSSVAEVWVYEISQNKNTEDIIPINGCVISMLFDTTTKRGIHHLNCVLVG